MESADSLQITFQYLHILWLRDIIPHSPLIRSILAIIPKETQPWEVGANERYPLAESNPTVIYELKEAHVIQQCGIGSWVVYSQRKKRTT